MRAQLPFVPDTAGQAIGEIGHADLRAGPGHPDGSGEQAYAGFLIGEDVLDEGVNF